MIECYGTAFSGSAYFPVNRITSRLVLGFLETDRRVFFCVY